MNDEYIIIITTCPDLTEAEKITEALISNKIAACVQTSEIRSTYLWKGNIETAPEIKLLIKTRTGLFDKVSASIKENSSYETPEIISVPIIMGSSEYLGWIDDVTV